MLGLDLRGRAHLADRWIRGGDLVAVYAPADARQLRATAMWRAVGPEAGVSGAVRAWEVVVSAQTSLLQSDATLAVASTARATSLAWGTITGGAGRDSADHVAWSAVVHEGRAPQARAVLVRRPAEPGQPATSVVVVVHADDGRGIAAWLDNGSARVECPLFGDVLEKGVLLRSRVLAAIGPAADDTSWAARVIRAYIALPPMLDT